MGSAELAAGLNVKLWVLPACVRGAFLAPDTSGPRDVPRFGALSSLQKTPHYSGGRQISARLNVKLCVLRGCGGAHLTPFFAHSSSCGN
jgi:hypothetical protein